MPGVGTASGSLADGDTAVGQLQLPADRAPLLVAAGEWRAGTLSRRRPGRSTGGRPGRPRPAPSGSAAPPCATRRHLCAWVPVGGRGARLLGTVAGPSAVDGGGELHPPTSRGDDEAGPQHQPLGEVVDIQRHLAMSSPGSQPLVEVGDSHAAARYGAAGAAWAIVSDARLNQALQSLKAAPFKLLTARGSGCQGHINRASGALAVPSQTECGGGDRRGG